jgi:hypothetical protein
MTSHSPASPTEQGHRQYSHSPPPELVHALEQSCDRGFWNPPAQDPEQDLDGIKYVEKEQYMQYNAPPPPPPNPLYPLTDPAHPDYHHHLQVVIPIQPPSPPIQAPPPPPPMAAQVGPTIQQ